MGLLNNITAGAGDAAEVLGKGQESAARKSFDRDFGTANFDEFGGDVQPGKEIEIARFTVPASTEYSWGYGSASNPENQGHLFVDLFIDDDGDSTTAAVEVEGSLILAQESPTGRGRDVIAEYDTTRLDASKSDKGLMVPLPEQVGHDLVTQDSSLVVYFDGNTSGTLKETPTDLIMPVTEYDLDA